LCFFSFPNTPNSDKFPNPYPWNGYAPLSLKETTVNTGEHKSGADRPAANVFVVEQPRPAPPPPAQVFILPEQRTQPPASVFLFNYQTTRKPGIYVLPVNLGL